jgi:hypothetical protein
MRATREMICSLNRGTGGNPVVTEVALSPFMPQDLASVSYDERLIEKKVPTELAIEELLATFIASSQVRHAPLMFGIGPTSFIEPFALLRRMSKQELFGWYKAVQRGVAIFLEKDLDGRSPNPNELRQLRDFIAEPMCERTQLENSYVHKMSRPLKSRTYRLLSSEFQKEPLNGAGLLTRFALAKVSYAVHRSMLRGWTSFWRVQAKIECSAQVGELAGSIVSSAMDAPRRRLAVLRAEKKATAK